MNTANKTLCEKLWKLTGWDNQGDKWIVYDAPQEGFEQLEPEVIPGAIESVYKNTKFPAYTLDYLLRKLPDTTMIKKVLDEYQACLKGQDWIQANNPEDAAIQLLLTLIEEGVLEVEHE